MLYRRDPLLMAMSLIRYDFRPAMTGTICRYVGEPADRFDFGAHDFRGATGADQESVQVLICVLRNELNRFNSC